ncbi:Endoribonuclease YbeY [Rhynchospora pubera]|uniref:Endoribonuclease YbeY n=1 Tax=Rhynchospora pubera TaxID=906938 RepID=A0AAV8HX77_9POAL|nr:Endoribonuclease YbeY [Rhynchospora pubera]
MSETKPSALSWSLSSSIQKQRSYSSNSLLLSLNPQSKPKPMARLVVARALPFSGRLRLPPPTISAAHRCYSPYGDPSSSHPHSALSRSALGQSPILRRGIHVSPGYSRQLPWTGYFMTAVRPLRLLRRRNGAAKKPPPPPPPPKEKEIELCLKIRLDDGLPNDRDVLNIAEMLKLNGPMAMKLAFDGISTSPATGDRSFTVTDVVKYEKVELSLVLCNDEYIRRINNEWRGEDHATDVLSVSHHTPDLDIPILLLGEVVISVETAARQAEEKGHTLLDEVRILLVHGLLRVLGFNHEASDKAKKEMEAEEKDILNTLGWKGNGLIKSSNDSLISDEQVSKDEVKKTKCLRFYRPKFSYIFCDMDGTLLNSKSQITKTTAEALKEAASRGVKIVIATGKTRPAAISALSKVGLAGKGGVVSNSSHGVFLQGLLVYGMQGREIYRRNLDLGVCREAFTYSMKNKVPLIAFCQDRCLTLFEHPSVDCLHTIYHEPKAEIIPSIEGLLTTAEIQKLIFLDTAEGVASTLRPFWEEATDGRAGVVQAVPDMLEIVPPETSKGKGVKMLLDHLGVSSKEVMAIGDGENDVEMLELASLGVALANGSEKAKSVANVIGSTNDEDGAAKAIYEYAF